MSGNRTRGFARWRPFAAACAAATALTIVAGATIGASAAAASGAAKADPSIVRQAALRPDSRFALIVREADPTSPAAERLVAQLGGTVTRELRLIGSLAVRLPGRALPALLRHPAVAQVTPDAHIHATTVNMSQYDGYSPNTVWKQTIAPTQASALNGSGVTVALVDTGISHVSDLGDRVLARVDFTPDHDGYDRYGHGTHMAGVIASDGSSSGGQWVGVAPQTNLVSVKVAGADGSTDVSVVIAGLQWVVAHRAEYNIRILNLSYGTDARQSYLIDPLDYAVEQVWFSGIFVVVASGNGGPNVGTVSKPGDDPFVMTVGAGDTRNTVTRTDDVVPAFSGRGLTQDLQLKPDLVAPSISIVSDRAAGSTLDQLHPTARVGDANFKGTGTSQATAVVSGVAAALFAISPSLTPDMAKAILVRTADKKILWNSGGSGAGAGMVDADAAVAQVKKYYGWIKPANQGLIRSTGLGSLESSRGGAYVLADLNGDGKMEPVTGEVDVLGNSWGGNTWNGNTWDGNSWDASEWASYVFLGNCWDGNTWNGNSWNGMAWSGNSWDGNSWDGVSWN